MMLDATSSSTLATQNKSSEISFVKHEYVYIYMDSQSASQLSDKRKMSPKGKLADKLFVG